MNTLLVTGISGFLGRHLSALPLKGWRLVGIFNNHPPVEGEDDYLQADLSNFNKVAALLHQIRPAAVLHLAAVSRPAACTADPDYSYKINVVISSLLADYARQKSIPFLFTSTDQVFDGKNAPYSYLSATKPINLYGKQKAEAERRILSIHPAATVVRLPLLYGPGEPGANFLVEWLSNWQQDRPVRAFTDEYRTPISVADAAVGILRLLTGSNPGIWHLGGPERLSRYEMGQQLAEEFGIRDDLLIPVTQKEMDLGSNRPADVSLINRNTLATGFKPGTFREEVRRMKKELEQILEISS